MDDPHIHVQSNVIRADAVVRNMIASTFGLAGDLPTVVTTGCGRRVPYAMTSTRPESVTCLACREHASTAHLRLAEQFERLGAIPGSDFSGARAAEGHRDLAKRFSAG